MIDIFLDERYIGNAENADVFVNKFKELRRTNKLPSELNIYFDTKLKEIHIESSRGRLRRPLIVLEKEKSKVTDEVIKKCKNGEFSWKDLINNGIIEYLDASEEENALVALGEEEITDKHTHLEISPSILLGLTTESWIICH